MGKDFKTKMSANSIHRSTGRFGSAERAAGISQYERNLSAMRQGAGEHQQFLEMERFHAGSMAPFVREPQFVPPLSIEEVAHPQWIPPPDTSRLEQLMARTNQIDAEIDAAVRQPPPMMPKRVVRQPPREPAGDYRPVAPPEPRRQEFHRALDATAVEKRVNMADLLHGPRLELPHRYPERGYQPSVHYGSPTLHFASDVIASSAIICSPHRTGNYIPPVRVKDIGYLGRGQISQYY